MPARPFIRRLRINEDALFNAIADYARGDHDFDSEQSQTLAQVLCEIGYRVQTRVGGAIQAATMFRVPAGRNTPAQILHAHVALGAKHADGLIERKTALTATQKAAASLVLRKFQDHAFDRLGTPTRWPSQDLTAEQVESLEMLLPSVAR